MAYFDELCDEAAEIVDLPDFLLVVSDLDFPVLNILLQRFKLLPNILESNSLTCLSLLHNLFIDEHLRIYAVSLLDQTVDTIILLGDLSTNLADNLDDEGI